MQVHLPCRFFLKGAVRWGGPFLLGLRGKALELL